MSSTTLTFTYKTDAAAGDIPAYVHFKPASEGDASPRPIAIVIHGGGYTVCGTFIIPRTQIDALLDLGFVVVCPEYRLSPQVTVTEGAVADCRACLAWVQTSLPALLEAQAGGLHVDPARVAAMGHSAGGNLALLLGGEAAPPRAILDVYAGLYPEREWNHRPQPAFAGVPDPDPAFVAKVYDGAATAVPLTSPPMFAAGRPDLSTPRNAFMISTQKDGSHLRKVTGGDYAGMDATRRFARGFPPTCILHGTADIYANYEYAVDAANELRALDVPVELITVPDQNHMFDLPLKRDDELFKYIQQGLEFLAKHT